MALKIIKQGSARASIVQQFLFSENLSEYSEPMECDAQLDIPSMPPIAAANTSSRENSQSSLSPAQLEKAAYEKGFSEGEKAGLEMAEKKLEAAMQRCGDAILELGKLRSFLFTQVEQQVVKLSMQVAQKIVRREIQADRDIIQTLVRVALGHVAEKSAVTIHLSPLDYNYLLEQRAELSQSEGRDISLLADKSIERGGCLIQTECGDIDARIEEQFREVESAFFEGLK
jgi:flagellar assembly protein FliH